MQQIWEREQEQDDVWEELSPENPLPLLTAGGQCFLETAQAAGLCVTEEEGT